MATWPQHPDGTNKRVGDMTPDEAREVFREAALRLKAEMERPAVQERVAHVLNNGTDH